MHSPCILFPGEPEEADQPELRQGILPLELGTTWADSFLAGSFRLELFFFCVLLLLFSFLLFCFFFFFFFFWWGGGSFPKLRLTHDLNPESCLVGSVLSEIFGG